MKRIFHLRAIPLAVSFYLLLITAGCSKNQFTNQSSTGESIIFNGAEARIANKGSVTGEIIPNKGIVKIILSNGTFATGDFYYVKGSRFRFDNIPAGIYQLAIIYRRSINMVTDLPVTQQYETFEYTIAGISVNMGEVSDIGEILLP